MGEDLPAVGLAGRHLLGVDGDDDALAPNFSAASATNSRSRTAAVLIDTLSAPASSSADVLDRAHAAADRQRHEAALGGARDDVEDGVAVLVAGGDVEEAELVGAGGVIGLRRLDRIAGIDAGRRS
jgi:hypothetical protein